MSDRDALLLMIERFGPISTLDLLLEEIRRLRARVDAMPENDQAELPGTSLDAPGQLRFAAIEAAA